MEPEGHNGSNHISGIEINYWITDIFPAFGVVLFGIGTELFDKISPLIPCIIFL